MLCYVSVLWLYCAADWLLLLAIAAFGLEVIDVAVILPCLGVGLVPIFVCWIDCCLFCGL